ncbi:amidohydrolase, partial [Mycobacterium hodleri]
MRALSDTLARWGVTGVTDATPDYTTSDVENLSAAVASGELRQRLHC